MQQEIQIEGMVIRRPGGQDFLEIGVSGNIRILQAVCHHFLNLLLAVHLQ